MDEKRVEIICVPLLAHDIVGSQNDFVPFEYKAQESSLKRYIPGCSESVGMYMDSLQNDICLDPTHLIGCNAA